MFKLIILHLLLFFGQKGNQQLLLSESTHTITTTNYGQDTIVGGSGLAGVANTLAATYVIVGSNAGGYSLNSVFSRVGTVTSGKRYMAIYSSTNSSGAGCNSANVDGECPYQQICQDTIGITATANTWLRDTLLEADCVGKLTITPNMKFWIVLNNDDASEQIVIVPNVCPGTLNTGNYLGSITAGTFSPMNGGNGIDGTNCYAQYVVLNVL